MVHLAPLLRVAQHLADDEAGTDHGEGAGEVGPDGQVGLLHGAPCHDGKELFAGSEFHFTRKFSDHVAMPSYIL